MKTIGRDKIRGKRMEHDCYSAKTSRHEFGEDDPRVFCHGLLDTADNILPKCLKCKAYTYNATPLTNGDDEHREQVNWDYMAHLH